MCGRLSLAVPASRLRERFDATPPGGLEPRYNVAPGEDLAVIRAQRPDRIDLLEWGLIPRWADDPGSGHVNARAETLSEKPSFAEAYERRRCLVLADGYYEWSDERGRGSRPYRVTFSGESPVAMAGIWERREGSGGTRETVAIVTTGSNEAVEAVHHRMPVVLDPESEDRWLRDGPDAAADLLDPYPAEETRVYPVSERVNDPSNDSPAVVEAVDPPEQRGLEDFA